MSLPDDKMYALRHGITGKIWCPCEGWWLFKSVRSMEKCWNTLKKTGIVTSNFSEHKIVTVELQEKACKTG